MIRTCLDPEWQPPKYADGSVWQEITPPQRPVGAPEKSVGPSIKPLEDAIIERMWVNLTIGATVSASAGRLVLSFSEFLPEEIYAPMRKLLQRSFRVDVDEPTWGWRQGNDKVEIAKQEGRIPRNRMMRPQWLWHYLDPKAPL